MYSNVDHVPVIALIKKKKKEKKKKNLIDLKQISCNSVFCLI